MCRAKLFPLPPAPRDYWFGSGIAVHPIYIEYFNPLQGPQPADCVREGEHEWHWDGKGTWWQGFADR